VLLSLCRSWRVYRGEVGAWGEGTGLGVVGVGGERVGVWG
jgi:hypothetical protein